MYIQDPLIGPLLLKVSLAISKVFSGDRFLSSKTLLVRKPATKLSNNVIKVLRRFINFTPNSLYLLIITIIHCLLLKTKYFAIISLLFILKFANLRGRSIKKRE